MTKYPNMCCSSPDGLTSTTELDPSAKGQPPAESLIKHWERLGSRFIQHRVGPMGGEALTGHEVVVIVETGDIAEGWVVMVERSRPRRKWRSPSSLSCHLAQPPAHEQGHLFRQAGPERVRNDAI